MGIIFIVLILIISSVIIDDLNLDEMIKRVALGFLLGVAISLSMSVAAVEYYSKETNLEIYNIEELPDILAEYSTDSKNEINYHIVPVKEYGRIEISFVKSSIPKKVRYFIFVINESKYHYKIDVYLYKDN